MASNVTVPNNFTNGTPSDADAVDANFDAITAWINANAVHLDSSKEFTAIPVVPAADPTQPNELARKAYVDSKSARYGFTVQRVLTPQSFTTGGDEAAVWDTITDNAGGAHSGVTGAFTFTVPNGKGGVYAVQTWANNSTGPGSVQLKLNLVGAMTGPVGTRIHGTATALPSPIQPTSSIQILPDGAQISVVGILLFNPGPVTVNMAWSIYRISE